MFVKCILNVIVNCIYLNLVYFSYTRKEMGSEMLLHFKSNFFSSEASLQSTYDCLYCSGGYFFKNVLFLITTMASKYLLPRGEKNGALAHLLFQSNFLILQIFLGNVLFSAVKGKRLLWSLQLQKQKSYGHFKSYF